MVGKVCVCRVVGVCVLDCEVLGVRQCSGEAGVKCCSVVCVFCEGMLGGAGINYVFVVYYVSTTVCNT